MLTPDSTLGDIRRAEAIPPPKAGGRYRPIPHGELLDHLRAAAEARGWAFRFLGGRLSRGGADLVASFVTGPVAAGDLVPCLGVAANTSGRSGLAFYCGAVEPAVGAVTVARIRDPSWKYEVGLKLDELAADALDRYGHCAEKLPKLRAYLSRRTLREDRALGLLTQAADRMVSAVGWRYVQAVTWDRVGRVYNLFRQLEVKNKWTLLLAFGSVAEQAPAENRMDQMLAFYRIVRGEK